MSPRVALLADYWRPGWRAGGPITSLGNLVDRTTVPVAVFTRDHDLNSSTSYPNVEANNYSQHGDTHVAYLRGATGVAWAFKQLRSSHPTAIHINSVHSPAFGILPLLALRMGLLEAHSILISPHGELSPASQAHKPLKKKLSRPILRRVIPHSAVWHATSRAEASDITAWLQRDPTLVIAPDSPPTPNTESLTRFVDVDEIPTILFASRIHPIKGLDRAISIVGQLSVPLRFVIAGPVEDERYWVACQALIDELPDSVIVETLGPYEPQDVASLVGAAHVFLLPTRGENFGQAIAEALASGCPVAIPPTTPWHDYIGPSLGCVSDSDTSLVAFLEEVLRESQEDHLRRRRAAFDAYLSWFETVSDDDIYAQVLGDTL